MGPKESDGFLRPKVAEQSGCWNSKYTKICCIATSAFAVFFLVLGIVVLLMGEGILEKYIHESMALTPGGARLASWLEPPVQPYMFVYGFHVKNPEAVLR